jgi:hypothetical protein
MPTAAETAYNKALNGAEVKELLRRDFEKLIGNFGELSDYIAYGKVGWSITLELQTGNAYSPTPSSTINGGEELPIKEAKGLMSKAVEIVRNVVSPNVERVHAGIPIPVKVKELDGTTVEKRIKYEAEDVKDLPPEDVRIKDATEAAQKKYRVI